MQIFNRGMLWVGVLVVLQACTVGPYVPRAPAEPADNAPRLTHADLSRLSQLPDPEVRAEQPSRGGNGPIYTVWGKSYEVMSAASGYAETGIASWYGTKFHGRKTSNGERFDIYRLTAAHKHLPIPSYVRVTNLDNGRQTIVRVNDRGPFHDNRIIDLSYAAAVKLGFHNKGTARVSIEVVEPSTRQYLVQAGAFSSLQGADRSQQQLQQLTGLSGVVVKTSRDHLYRVQLGPVADGAELTRVQNILQASEYGKPKLIEVRCNSNQSRC